MHCFFFIFIFLFISSFLYLFVAVRLYSYKVAHYDTDRMYTYEAITEGGEADDFWGIIGPQQPYPEEFIDVVSCHHSDWLVALERLSSPFFFSLFLSDQCDESGFAFCCIAS